MLTLGFGSVNFLITFGNTSGREFFKNIFYGLLKDISGVEYLLDDIFVYLFIYFGFHVAFNTVQVIS